MALRDIFKSSGQPGDLSRVVTKNDIRSVKRLLKAGADINERSKNGETPLIWAAFENRLDMARLLIDHGADIHAKDGLGYSALYWATYQGHTEMARLLIDKGADISLETRFPGGARHEHYEIAQMIKDARILKKQQTTEKEKARIIEPPQNSDELSKIIASGNLQQARAYFERGFWEKRPAPATWDHLKIAVLREDKPMMRLLIIWGATATEADIATLPGPGQHVHYIQLLRQCGLRVNPSLPTPTPATPVLPDTQIQPPPTTLDTLPEKIPQEWKNLLEAFQQNDAKSAVIAGGALRDLLHEKPVRNVDIFVKDRGSAQENVDFVETVFTASETPITEPAGFINEWGDQIRKFPQPEIRRLYHISHTEKIPHISSNTLESWTVTAGADATQYTIRFVKGDLKKRPVFSFGPRLIEDFDFDICQIAYNGREIITTPQFQEAVQHKKITSMREGSIWNEEKEHLRRIVQKYPDWELCKTSQRMLAPPPKISFARNKKKFRHWPLSPYGY